MGTDELHPEFGSILDGGRLPNGTPVKSLFGTNDWAYIAMVVESEIRRIAENLQNRQAASIKQDGYTYGKTTLTPGETLESITDISMIQDQNRLKVSVILRTANGQQATLELPINSGNLITTR
jgi:hypothetical protein